MNEEPKLCPFCGWGTIVDGGIFKHYCECYACHAKGKPSKTWEEAVAAWNRRANNLDRVVEQLKDLKPYKLDLADAMMDTLENGKYRHFVCLEEVLNIVKAGGIDDSQT